MRWPIEAGPGKLRCPASYSMLHQNFATSPRQLRLLDENALDQESDGEEEGVGFSFSSDEWWAQDARAPHSNDQAIRIGITMGDAADILAEVAALVDDESRIVSYKWLARNYSIPANQAKR